MSYRYRINYNKNEGMRYTSNLDIHKMWERTFRRAKLPLVYSQGFHPQPKIQLASPLPLGFLSEFEIVDFVLERELEVLTLKSTLSLALPLGISINSIKSVDLREPALQTQTEASEYHIFFLEELDPTTLEQELSKIEDQTSIKRTRRGKSYDLRPLILSIELITGSKTYIKMVLSSKDGATGRPEEVLSELGIPLETTRIIRKKIILMNDESSN